MQIKNIIFDLGGVLLDLDFHKTITGFNKFIADKNHHFDLSYFQAELLSQYEIGAVTTQHFRSEFKKQFKIMMSDEEFNHAWNLMLINLPLERLQFLHNFKEEKQLRTFLFSNINELHFNAVQSLFETNNLAESFRKCFDKEYYSHLLGKRKPHAEGFLHILEENQLRAEETVFIDDYLPNVEGAKKLGLHTIHFAPGTEFKLLPELIQAVEMKSC